MSAIRDKVLVTFVFLWMLFASPMQAKAANWVPGPVTDQGSTPSCVTHAALGLIRSQPIHSTIEMDGNDFYWLIRKEYHAENMGPGLYPGWVFDWLEQHNYISDYTMGWGYYDAIDMLDKGPIAIVTEWYQGMERPDQNDRVHPTGTARDNGRSLHMYLVYGDEDKVVQIQNSWGTQWGGDGRASMSITEFQILLERSPTKAVFQAYVYVYNAHSGIVNLYMI